MGGGLICRKKRGSGQKLRGRLRSGVAYAVQAFESFRAVGGNDGENSFFVIFRYLLVSKGGGLAGFGLDSVHFRASRRPDSSESDPTLWESFDERSWGAAEDEFLPRSGSVVGSEEKLEPW